MLTPQDRPGPDMSANDNDRVANDTATSMADGHEGVDGYLPQDHDSNARSAKAVVTLADVLTELRRIRQALVATQALAVGEKDLARLLGISAATLSRWKAAGQLIRGIKKNGRILYSMEEVRQWVAASMPDRKTWEAMRKQC